HNRPVRSQEPPALVAVVRAGRHLAPASVRAVRTSGDRSVAATAVWSRLITGCLIGGSPTPAAPGTGAATVPGAAIDNTAPDRTRYQGASETNPSGLNCGQDPRGCTASVPATGKGCPPAVITTPRIDGTCRSVQSNWAESCCRATSSACCACSERSTRTMPSAGLTDAHRVPSGNPVITAGANHAPGPASSERTKASVTSL